MKNTLEGFLEQIADVKERARKVGREDKVRFAVMALRFLKRQRLKQSSYFRKSKARPIRTR